MSIKAYEAVWQSSRADGTTLLVLLALAKHANTRDDDRNVWKVWPCVKTLARLTRRSERQVTRGIRRAMSLHELRVLSRGSGRDSQVYELVTNAASGVTYASPPDGSRVDTRDTAGLTRLSRQGRHRRHRTADTGVTQSGSEPESEPESEPRTHLRDDETDGGRRTRGRHAYSTDVVQKMAAARARLKGRQP